MSENMARLEALEKKTGILQATLHATRQSVCESFPRHGARLEDLEKHPERQADDMRRKMDDAALEWWACFRL